MNELLCKKAIEIIKQTADFIRDEKDRVGIDDIDVKDLNSFATYVDRQAEQMLAEGLNKLVPEAGFIAEEETVNGESLHYNWIIDPLDGTTNYLHGLPCFSISVALADKQSAVLGIVYELNMDECFYSWEGGPAYLNDEIIKVSGTTTLKDSLIGTGFPYHDFSHLESYTDIFKYLMKNTRGIRRLGSAAVDLAYVACGRFDGFYEYGLNSWDVAAGAFLVKQAGGKVTDFMGGENYVFGEEMLACNEGVHQEFLELIQKYFP